MLTTIGILQPPYLRICSIPSNPVGLQRLEHCSVFTLQHFPRFGSWALLVFSKWKVIAWATASMIQAENMLVQALSLIFYVLPSAMSLHNPCKWMSAAVIISASLRWTFWNAVSCLNLCKIFCCCCCCCSCRQEQQPATHLCHDIV